MISVHVNTISHHNTQLMFEFIWFKVQFVEKYESRYYMVYGLYNTKFDRAQWPHISSLKYQIVLIDIKGYICKKKKLAQINRNYC